MSDELSADEKQRLGKIAGQLVKIGVKFVQFPIPFIDLHHLTSVAVYYEKDANNSHVWKLLGEREPHHCNNTAAYDATLLKTQFGYEKSPYGNEDIGRLNIGVFAKGICLHHTTTYEIAVFHAAGLALEDAADADYRWLQGMDIDNVRDNVTSFYLRYFQKIFTVAKWREYSRIVFEGDPVARLYFDAGLTNNAASHFKTITSETDNSQYFRRTVFFPALFYVLQRLELSLKTSIHFLNADVFSVCGFPEKKWPENVTVEFTSHGTFPGCLEGKNEEYLDQTLFVNDWNPYAFVGNGNCRSSGMNDGLKKSTFPLITWPVFNGSRSDYRFDPFPKYDASKARRWMTKAEKAAAVKQAAANETAAVKLEVDDFSMVCVDALGNEDPKQRNPTDKRMQKYLSSHHFTPVPAKREDLRRAVVHSLVRSLKAPDAKLLAQTRVYYDSVHVEYEQEQRNQEFKTALLIAYTQMMPDGESSLEFQRVLGYTESLYGKAENNTPDESRRINLGILCRLGTDPNFIMHVYSASMLSFASTHPDGIWLRNLKYNQRQGAVQQAYWNIFCKSATALDDLDIPAPRFLVWGNYQPRFGAWYDDGAGTGSDYFKKQVWDVVFAEFKKMCFAKGTIVVESPGDGANTKNTLFVNAWDSRLLAGVSETEQYYNDSTLALQSWLAYNDDMLFKAVRKRPFSSSAGSSTFSTRMGDGLDTPMIVGGSSGKTPHVEPARMTIAAQKMFSKRMGDGLDTPVAGKSSISSEASSFVKRIVDGPGFYMDEPPNIRPAAIDRLISTAASQVTSPAAIDPAAIDPAAIDPAAIDPAAIDPATSVFSPTPGPHVPEAPDARSDAGIVRATWRNATDDAMIPYLQIGGSWEPLTGEYEWRNWNNAVRFLNTFENRPATAMTFMDGDMVRPVGLKRSNRVARYGTDGRWRGR